MDAVILCGLPGSGKSSFFWARYFDTHVRISLDLLRTRGREALFLDACLRSRQPFVVDKTNLRPDQRARYVAAAREAGYSVSVYYLDVPVGEALARNERRDEGRRVPRAAILGARRRLVIPAPEEGFHALFRVRSPASQPFSVEDLDAWRWRPLPSPTPPS